MKRTKHKRREYVPTSLRPRGSGKHYEVWNIGMLDFQKKYAYMKGPFYTELAALEITGKTNYLIIYSNTDGIKTPLWRWEKHRWIELKGNEKDKFSEA